MLSRKAASKTKGAHTFAAFAIDKIHAIEGKSRIRILTLLGLAFMGGSVGALLGIYILRHKTKVDYFTVGIPLIMVMQGVALGAEHAPAPGFA